jgi:hypothetical protein
VIGLALTPGSHNVQSVVYDNDAKEWLVTLQTAPSTTGCIPMAIPFAIGDRIATVGSGVSQDFYIGIQDLTTHQMIPGNFTFAVLCP